MVQEKHQGTLFDSTHSIVVRLLTCRPTGTTTSCCIIISAY
jgi:hypothetical protein